MRRCGRNLHDYDESKQRQCQECKRVSNQTWADANLEKVRKSANAHYKKNADVCREKGKRFRAKNREIYNAHQRNYSRVKRDATPKWLDFDQLVHIEKHYILAGLMARDAGTPMAVDHIVPLRGKNVCGLHVPWNLQIMARAANSQKGNRNGF